MSRIQRPTIEPYVRPVAPQFNESLGAVMARFAERLERAKPELVDVTTMWLDVVADLRRRSAAVLKTELTQRVLEKLVLPDPRPAGSAVPSVPFRRSAANAHRRQSVI
jgi:hypothetical protein